MFLELINLTKLFDKDNGIEDVSLSIKEGEFITIFMFPPYYKYLYHVLALSNLPIHRRNGYLYDKIHLVPIFCNIMSDGGKA
jgi:hypothetical protein